jgi:hypothetical protein
MEGKGGRAEVVVRQQRRGAQHTIFRGAQGFLAIRSTFLGKSIEPLAASGWSVSSKITRIYR